MIVRQESETQKIGQYQVERTPDAMTLRLDNQGDISMKGCLLFAFTMLCMTFLGILSVVQASQVQHRDTIGDPSQMFQPQENHFGFLWLILMVIVLVGIPLYAHQSYKASLEFTFRRTDLTFLRNRKRVTRFGRIEYVLLRETKDTDGRYLYLLEVSYNDGMRMMVYNGYDDREIMNLANEISKVVGCRVVWK